MNHGDMAVLMKGIAPVMRETIIKAMQPIVNRLVMLEAREPLKGEPGRDGFGLEDFSVEAIDERTVDLRFTRGDETHSYELKFPVPVYRNVFKQGESYARGDIVTWGGCAWYCEKDTGEKPEAGENWSLMVKKGRDGKDAKHG